MPSLAAMSSPRWVLGLALVLQKSDPLMVRSLAGVLALVKGQASARSWGRAWVRKLRLKVQRLAMVLGTLWEIVLALE